MCTSPTHIPLCSGVTSSTPREEENLFIDTKMSGTKVCMSGLESLSKTTVMYVVQLDLFWAYIAT